MNVKNDGVGARPWAETLLELLADEQQGVRAKIVNARLDLIAGALSAPDKTVDPKAPLVKRALQDLAQRYQRRERRENVDFVMNYGIVGDLAWRLENIHQGLEMLAHAYTGRPVDDQARGIVVGAHNTFARARDLVTTIAGYNAAVTLKPEAVDALARIRQIPPLALAGVVATA